MAHLVHGFTQSHIQGTMQNSPTNDQMQYVPTWLVKTADIHQRLRIRKKIYIIKVFHLTYPVLPLFQLL